MSYLKNDLSWFNLCNTKYGRLEKHFFYVDIPYMKCEESCFILKIIYHGLISAIGNMDGWQIILFIFYVNIPCMKCEESCSILQNIYHGLIFAIGNMDRWQNIILFFLC